MDHFHSVPCILKLITYHDRSALNLEVVRQLSAEATQLLARADRQNPRRNAQHGLQTETHFCGTYPLARTDERRWFVTDGNETLLNFMMCWDCTF